MRRRTRTGIAAMVVGGFLLVACGDDDDAVPPPPANGEATVTVMAEPGLEFNATSFATEAGSVTFEYVNNDVQRHTLVIEGRGDLGLEVNSQGDIDSGTVELDAGEYTIFCDVPGHREVGMEADLTVS